MTVPPPSRSARSHTALGLIVAAVVLAADQASKFWILNVLDLESIGRVDLVPTLSFTMVWNRGVTFGLLTGTGSLSRFILAGIALVVVAALFLWLRRAESAWTAGAIGAIAGGAVGNVADRLRFGAVVDFIHFHVGTWSWYVFNVADAAIVCGVALLVLDGLWPHRQPDPDGPPDRLMRPRSGAREGS